MAQLSGKVALITGAGSGIGKGIARAFAHAGASLVLAGRTAEKLEATAEELRPTGVLLVVVPTDLADSSGPTCACSTIASGARDRCFFTSISCSAPPSAADAVSLAAARYSSTSDSPANRPTRRRFAWDF